MMPQTGIVSLSYDGSHISHLETAFPHLQETGLKATFYCEPALLLENLPEWAEALASGHEIGNGSLHGAVLDDGTLPGWSLEMVQDDIAEARALIEDLFPEQPAHSFAFPWGQSLSDGIDVAPAAREIYDVVRMGQHGINKAPFDLKRINVVTCDDLDSCELVSTALTALEEGTWVVFAFEGVGVGERGVDACAHRDLCVFLATDPRFSVLPVVSAASALAGSPAKNYKLV